MHHNATNELSILLALAFIIFASPYFSKLTKIPIAPVEIILGIVIGYFGFLPESELFKVVAEVGFFYLMFLAGTEIDLKLLLKVDRKILKLGIAWLGVLYFIAGIMAFGLKFGILAVIIIPLMSVGLLSTLYKEYGKDQQWLNLAMIVGSIGEVLSIILITLIGAYVDFGNSIELFLNINYLILFIAFCIIGFKGLEVLFWWYPNLKVILMPHYDKDEKDIRLSMALFFSTVAVMIFLNLEIAFGAFIAGSFIATFFEHKKDLPHKLSSFGFGFLVPTFFVYIGSTVNLNSILIPGVLEKALALAVGLVILRLLPSFFFVKILGFKGSVLFGLSLSMPLTLLIAIATIAHKANTISENLYFSFILASLFGAIFCMIAIKIIMIFKFKLKK